MIIMCEIKKQNFIMSDKLSKYERETHINIDEVDNMWIAESSIQKDINKFKRNGWTIKSETYYGDGKLCSVIFTAPRNCISIRNVNKIKRKLSEEEKVEFSERMRKSRGTN